MQNSGVFYVRYMDDWVILVAPTRWKLKKTIRPGRRSCHERYPGRIEIGFASEGGPPNKTFIGKISKGFDRQAFLFLGYHLTQDGLGIAEKTIRNYAERANQLHRTACRKGSTKIASVSIFGIG